MVRLDFFKTIVVALAAVCLMATPVMAQQAGSATLDQGVPSPAIVQSLGDARDEAHTISSVSAALLGAAAGALALNVITGGAALTPIIGLPASNILGGTWMAATGSLPLAGEMAVHTVTAATVAFGGALMGMYFVSE
ncbi:hypothetical protein [Thalassobaculum litoreum]|nr:hypothetical protein [Thalassobaculum litoreum]